MMILENLTSACSSFNLGAESLFDWQEGKGNPSQPPLVPKGTSCGTSGEGPIARLNMLPPVKGGWGGCLLVSQGEKFIENFAK